MHSEGDVESESNPPSYCCFMVGGFKHLEKEGKVRHVIPHEKWRIVEPC